MRSDKRNINIRYGNGKVKRLLRDKAALLVEEGKAEYISNTLYRAASWGVKVKPNSTEAQIKAAIKKARSKPKPEPKKEEVQKVTKKAKKKRRRNNKKK